MHLEREGGEKEREGGGRRKRREKGEQEGEQHKTNSGHRVENGHE